MMFILRTKGQLTYLQLAWQGAIAIFSTRCGGLSVGSYQGLNLGLHVGDEKAQVLANRQLLAEIVKRPLSEFVGCQQVHGNTIASVGTVDLGRGATSLETAIPHTDGLLTNSSIPLFALFADCVPIWLYDPKVGAGGVVHAGWRGTTAGIASEAVAEMERHFGSRRENILAAIGPSIGPCCYRVGEEVVAKAEELKVASAPYFVPQGKGSYAADLAGFNRALLLEAGLVERKIATCGFCTSCQPDLFFSHRRDGGSTGRMAAVFLMQEGRR